MGWVVARAVAAAAGASALLLILTSIAPHHGRRLIAGWLVVLALLAARVLLQALLRVRVPSGSAFDAALRAQRAGPTQPAELERVRRLLLLASASATHTQTRLRPRLRRVAADRLTRHHGVRLDAQPEAARRLLGEPAWGLIGPDVPPADDPPADDRFARGPSLATIDQAIRALEEL